MKLIFCTKCHDVIRLLSEVRRCQCGASSGWYKEDGHKAKIKGPCTPLGFDNPSFVDALRQRPGTGRGSKFLAFVIPVNCKTIEVED